MTLEEKILRVCAHASRQGFTSICFDLTAKPIAIEIKHPTSGGLIYVGGLSLDKALDVLIAQFANTGRP